MPVFVPCHKPRGKEHGCKYRVPQTEGQGERKGFLPAPQHQNREQQGGYESKIPKPLRRGGEKPHCIGYFHPFFIAQMGVGRGVTVPCEGVIPTACEGKQGEEKKSRHIYPFCPGDNSEEDAQDGNRRENWSEKPVQNGGCLAVRRHGVDFFGILRPVYRPEHRRRKAQHAAKSKHRRRGTGFFKERCRRKGRHGQKQKISSGAREKGPGTARKGVDQKQNNKCSAAGINILVLHFYISPRNNQKTTLNSLCFRSAV